MTQDEILLAVREHFPTASAVEVVGPNVWVVCDPEPDWTGWRGRARPGGTVLLGTSPATARLAREILED